MPNDIVAPGSGQAPESDTGDDAASSAKKPRTRKPATSSSAKTPAKPAAAASSYTAQTEQPATTESKQEQPRAKKTSAPRSSATGKNTKKEPANGSAPETENAGKESTVAKAAKTRPASGAKAAAATPEPAGKKDEADKAAAAVKGTAAKARTVPKSKASEKEDKKPARRAATPKNKELAAKAEAQGDSAAVAGPAGTKDTASADGAEKSAPKTSRQPAKRGRTSKTSGTGASAGSASKRQDEGQKPQVSALQIAGENLPELKVESVPAVLEENYPAVHQNNLPAVSEQSAEAVADDSAEAAAPAKKGRRSRGGRSQKKHATQENGQESKSAVETQESIPPGEAPEADSTEEPAKPRQPQKAEVKSASAAKAAPKTKRKMFVSVLAGEQVEVVIAEDGQVSEYYVEMLHQAKVKGNIYKGVIHNVDPNLQAAFVSYGAVKNGFLQIDEVHPEYYLAPHEQSRGHKYPLIQKVLKAGQEILVQVVKEPSGTKGAFLTSYLSLPGRYLVLTPGREQIGVSRKVGNDTERSRLREILNSLNPGEGLGVIVRTVSEGASKTNLQRDLRFLKRLWTDVRKKGSTEPAPALIYQELGLAARAVRDYFTDDVAELWVDDEDMAVQMQEVITLLFPKRSGILQMHKDNSQSLFDRFGLSRQINQVQSREVVLPSGGRLVFDHTEALTAIDINSGRSGGKNNFEDMAFKINLEAAKHIPLQLRLRDIGGQVVVDFIEMRDRNHWREVEKTFRAGMKGDRARHDVGKISSFGLLEVVRQRLGSSAISIASEPCPFCNGTGMRRNMEWQAMQALQEIQNLLRQSHEPGKTLVYEATGELILYLLNKKKERLLEMESDSGVKLELRPGL